MRNTGKGETGRSWKKNRDGRLAGIGGGQEAAGKKLHVREYHRYKNIETVISQTPLLLLHTAWRRGLRGSQVCSNWRFIKHSLTSIVT